MDARTRAVATSLRQARPANWAGTSPEARAAGWAWRQAVENVAEALVEQDPRLVLSAFYQAAGLDLE